jgi:hypothetical protein
MSDDSLNRADFVGFQAEVRAQLGEMSQKMGQLFPLLLAQSGETAVRATMQRDIENAHAKLREHAKAMTALDKRIEEVHDNANARMDRAESRQNKIFWMFMGGAGVMQFLFMLFTWLIDHGFLGK